jgi:hypothetical protein
MGCYIFITSEGYTFEPGREYGEGDIENCQVVGFAEGGDEREAFAKLVEENGYLLETNFDELMCLELKDVDYLKRMTHFHLSDAREAGWGCYFAW